jgi:hypothetical protein
VGITEAWGPTKPAFNLKAAAVLLDEACLVLIGAPRFLRTGSRKSCRRQDSPEAGRIARRAMKNINIERLKNVIAFQVRF